MTDGTDLKILIADDEPLAAERMQMLLARIEGVAGRHRPRDGEARYAWPKRLSEPGLLDIAMPGLDGIEVARAFRDGESPAVVFVTA
jgi:two-component system response regulator AlgR